MPRYGQRTRVGQAVSKFGQPLASAGSLVVDYLVVASGGGGGLANSGVNQGSGGGGAG